MPFRGLIALVLATALGAATPGRSAAAPAADPGAPAAPAPSQSLTVGDVTVSAREFRTAPGGGLEAVGDVTVENKGARIQADRLSLRENRYVEAEGNVLIVWGASRISGTSMSYDLESQTGVIENAIGQFTDQYDLYFQAARAEKYAEDRILLTGAEVSTCTQPTPYWSFRVSSADVHLDHYARMKNLRLKVRGVPLFYLPWMAWPVKRDRALGFLIPRIGNSATRGRIVGEDLFIPVGRSVNLKLGAEWYSLAGFAGLGDLEAIPNQDGAIRASGFFINDQIAGIPRWSLNYTETQKFRNGFRMVADINRISDFNFYSDYYSDLALVSSPQVLTRVEFSRNASWLSLAVRELRREQLFTDGSSLIQQTLPQIELNGRSRRLGKTPLYLTFASSATAITQSSDLIDARYVRFDASPTFSAPLSPVPWMDLTPAVNLRSTWWSESQVPGSPLQPTLVENKPLFRNVAGFTLEMVGPKLFRIYGDPDDPKAPRYKHSLQGRIAYQYQQGFDRSTSIIPYDAVDLFIGDTNQVTYGIETFVIAQRPRAVPKPTGGEGERIVTGDDAAGKPHDVPQDAAPGGTAGAPAPAVTREPVQIVSFQLQQRYAFDRYLSFADLNRDTVNDASSKLSDIEASGRYSPSEKTGAELRASYHPLYHQVDFVSLSGSYTAGWFHQQSSIVYTPGLGVYQAYDPILNDFVIRNNLDSAQVRYNAGLSLWDRKILLDADGTWDVTARGGSPPFPYIRVRFTYYTQCCGFLAQYVEQDFTTQQRRDFRVTVDLRGIGKLFDWAGTR